MSTYFRNEHVALYAGDVRDTLRQLEPESVDCVITSPPYFSLRSYPIPPSIWGGDPACEHVWGTSTQLDKRGSGTFDPSIGRQRGETYGRNAIRGEFCTVCQAWRGQLGLEPHPFLYVDNMVEIFREVRRVLKPEGTVWLNLADCYSSGGCGTSERHQRKLGKKIADTQALGPKSILGFPSKSLMGMPWRVALALQNDGWILRSDIIWERPNTMPESVKDRPTRSHEYVFLLAKQEKYYYNSDAIREPIAESSRLRIKQKTLDTQEGGYKVKLYQENIPGKKALDRAPQEIIKHMRDSGQETRNRRTVWRIPTTGYRRAHFAVMPTALVEPCVLAGCPEGGVVLDPFGGSGTVAAVAVGLGRKSIYIDMSKEYADLAVERLSVTEYVA